MYAQCVELIDFCYGKQQVDESLNLEKRLFSSLNNILKMFVTLETIK